MKTTILRQRMTEDMHVRNLSRQTQASYVLQVSQFARYFNKSPAVLGPEEIRSYQVYLTNQEKLEASSIKVAVAALDFVSNYSEAAVGFWSDRSQPQGATDLADHFQPRRGGAVSWLHTQHQASDDFDRLLRRRVAHHRGGSPKAGSHRQTADGHPHRGGQGAKGTAMSCCRRNCWRC